MKFVYEHMEWIKDIPEPSLAAEEEIFLWGAGKIGEIVAYVLNQKGLEFEGFVDIAREKHGTIWCGYNVISPEELCRNHPNATVIVSCAFPVTIDRVKELGFKRVLDPVFLLKEIDFSEFHGVTNLVYAVRNVESALRNYALYYGTGAAVERLVLVITDKCSLNCKNCDGYVPYHRNPKHDSYETVISSYERVMKVCGYVESLDVMGGEPLVHPDIAKVIKHIAEDKRSGKVTVISNGTIMPSQELIEILKNKKCLFRLSDYGKTSSKKDALIELFTKEEIAYEITNYQYWDSVPKIQRTNQSEAELDKKFAECTSNVFYLKNGRFFQCNFVAGLSSLEGDFLPDIEKNYIELLNGQEEDIHGNIRKFIERLHNRKHIDACKYCPGHHCILFENKVPVAEQIEGKLPFENLFKDGVKI